MDNFTFLPPMFPIFGAFLEFFKNSKMFFQARLSSCNFPEKIKRNGRADP